jgi:hypothetical protein
MSSGLALKPSTHVVDILGNVIGRDQPIMLMEKAIELVSLLGEENFKSDDVVFFDPFCKAGEILLACALASCWARSKDNTKLLDVDYVQKELYESNRYFALAPDERHHRLSLRTFLGNTNSHNEKYNHIIRDGHYLSEIDGRLDRDKFEREFNSMLEYIKGTSKKKKIIAVGNPPYQENDGGHGGSAKAVYNLFTEALMDSRDISEFVLVIPSRWFTTGKGAKGFRERILKSKTVKTIHHFLNSKSVFPTVDVQGGVCFFHHKSDYNDNVQFVMNGESSTVDLSKFDIILDDPRGYDLIGKVKKHWDGDYVSRDAWTVRPWAIRTFYFERKKPLPDGHKDAVPCFSKRRKIMNADIKDIPKNKDKIDDWKVAVPKGYSLGSRRVTLPPNQFFIVPKGHITTETYNIVGSFKKKSEAENFRNYLATNFARYFLGLRKVTQDIYKMQWDWIPLVDVSREWTDEQLYKMFKITKEEQDHIARKLEEWS